LYGKVLLTDTMYGVSTLKPGAPPTNLEGSYNFHGGAQRFTAPDTGYIMFAAVPGRVSSTVELESFGIQYRTAQLRLSQLDVYHW
jgi:hypothetical protein